MAEFEWAMSLAFDSPDDRVAPIDELAALAGDAWLTLRLGLHSSAQKLLTRWNVAAFWQTVHDENEAPQWVESETATP